MIKVLLAIDWSLGMQVPSEQVESMAPGQVGAAQGRWLGQSQHKVGIMVCLWPGQDGDREVSCIASIGKRYEMTSCHLIKTSLGDSPVMMLPALSEAYLLLR